MDWLDAAGARADRARRRLPSEGFTVTTNAGED